MVKVGQSNRDLVMELREKMRLLAIMEVVTTILEDVTLMHLVKFMMKTDIEYSLVRQ